MAKAAIVISRRSGAGTIAEATRRIPGRADGTGFVRARGGLAACTFFLRLGPNAKLSLSSNTDLPHRGSQAPMNHSL